MPGTIFTYWEGPKPAYIGLCLETISVANKHHPVVKLSPELLPEYLDHIFVDNLNRSNFRFSFQDPYWESLMPAHRADIIRIEMLQKYGGLWIDSDFIALNSFAPLIESSQINHALYYYHDGERNTNGFLCAPKNHSMIVEWSRNNHAVFRNLKRDNIIPSPGNRWTSFGADQLDAVIKNPFDAHKDIGCGRVGPILYRDMSRFFVTESPENLFLQGTVWGAAYGYMLFNTGFPDWFKKLSSDEILKGPWFISRLFRFALGISDAQ